MSFFKKIFGCKCHKDCHCGDKEHCHCGDKGKVEEKKEEHAENSATIPSPEK